MVTKQANNQAQLRFLVTPEGVSLPLEIAPVGTRLAAFLLDMLFITAAIVVFTLVAVATGMGTGSALFGQIIVVAWLLAIFVFRNFWFILFEMGSRSATPGKRITGLRVVARGGGRLDGRAIVARNLLRDVEMFLPVGFMIQQGNAGSFDALSGLFGFGWTMLFLFFPLFNRDRMRAGDLIAGTWVIRAQRRAAGHDLLDVASGRHRFSEAQLAAYGAFELQTLEDLLRKGNPASLALVARTIRGKIDYPDDDHDAEFLSAYYAAMRLRLERGMLFGRLRKDKHDKAA